MTFSRGKSVCFGLGALLIGAFGCACSAGGDKPDAEGTSGGSGNTPSGTGNTANTGNGTGASSAEQDAGLLRDTGAPDDDAEIGDACAADEHTAKLTQLNLVFIYDKSASMGDGVIDSVTGLPAWQNMETRWNPAKAAMIDFFTNSGANAQEVYASLKFFPANGDYDATCNHDYSRPDVPLTSLEEPSALIAALEKMSPGGGTPTLPAVQGGIKYARQLMIDYPGSISVVVLVTDGEPWIYYDPNPDPDVTGDEYIRQDDCPAGATNDVPTIGAVLEAAYKQTPSVPTYVIAIGDSITDLMDIAAKGGTEPLWIEDTSTTQEKLLSKLQDIQNWTFACDMPVPKPPSGIIDYNQVNFTFVRTDGTEQKIYKNTKAIGDCVGEGWRYDKEPVDGAIPSKILLCDATCDMIQSDMTGHLNVIFGCPTIVL